MDTISPEQMISDDGTLVTVGVVNCGSLLKAVLAADVQFPFPAVTV